MFDMLGGVIDIGEGWYF